MHKVYVPGPHRFSKAEYHQMHDLGFFTDQYVELIDGEIVDMPVPGNRHCISTDVVAEQLRKVFGPNHWVRMQMPLNLSAKSEPMPDVAAVVGAARTHTETPTAALLVVEVSETTLADDRGRKASLYPSAGIVDYWIVNLVDTQLEVHSNPVADASAPFGFRYAEVKVLRSSDHASPLARPAAQILVSELLP